jgi:hypothetical protein
MMRIHADLLSCPNLNATVRSAESLSIAAILAKTFAEAPFPSSGKTRAVEQETGNEYRWPLTTPSGIATIGVGSGVEDQMPWYGFNVTSPNYLFEGTEHPYSTIGYQWIVSGRTTIASMCLLGFILASGPLGTTDGYNGDWYTPVEYGTLVVAPVTGGQQAGILSALSR